MTISGISAATSLGISQQQRQQIGQIVSDERNGSISAQQAKSQIAGVLTPEQRSQLKAGREHEHGHGNAASASSSSTVSPFTDIANALWAQQSAG